MRALILGLLLFTGATQATCEKSVLLGNVDYAKNSSYFSTQDSLQLDKIVADNSDNSSGYLLLEFNMDKSIGDEDLQKYNMWLANRRIERVKEYLTAAHFSHPIVTRIRTATHKNNREVSLHWCNNQQMMATIEKPSAAE
ncbi:hypothetical protein [Shewanella algae]|uniref:hypothetical protein n=1 Tax=Shewanella algae TaxID=38313 RepID=UPI003005B472